MTKIIAIEGIDGSGKNTLTRAIASHLNEQGFTTSTVSFPVYGTTYADTAKEFLDGVPTTTTLTPRAMAMLFALDRKLNKNILDADTDFLIVDRYVASNVAYTVAQTGDDEHIQWINDFEFGNNRLPKPDLTVLVDTDVDTSRKRVKQRAEDTTGSENSRGVDTYEKDSALQGKVRDAYLRLAEQGFSSPWITVDNTKNTPEDNAKIVVEQLKL